MFVFLVKSIAAATGNEYMYMYIKTYVDTYVHTHAYLHVTGDFVKDKPAATGHISFIKS